MLKKLINFPSIVAIILLLSQTSLVAQDKPRASPPQTTSAEVNGKTITINYSSPSKKDRVIWGDLVKYDKVWRTGANEATTIEVSEDVKINGKALKKGKYSLFTIPREGKWTVIINSNANQWGAYSYKEGKDVLRFDVMPTSAAFSELFTIDISDRGVVTIAWDKLKVEFTVE
ncbi:DUF2911 domain-containing protein [Reichenbachiella agariperforans]|uniref:DUF2911 domain-containing protein n=1 Tax=Reichenbachiella agariperforans TaxID=156994 RepID=UPI001C083535|nr:DUF2911 domain-containing protein [Reichenbachiella agariperforans]MBU2915358.1 DUF2911 domain-containing protein [Reichenbachiella agariperforans]